MSISPAGDIAVEETAKAVLSSVTVFLMAAACAASVANVYYNQPLLSAFASSFHISVAKAGLVATAAQIGYGAGLLFFIPLGDVFERKKIVLYLAYTCALLLGFMALSKTLWMLVTLQLLVGLTAVSPQLLIPLAVDLSAPEVRGRTVGTLMAGLLTGLLLARTAAGLIADWMGWSAVFWIAAAAMLVTAIVLQRMLPRRLPTLQISYGTLIRSLMDLLREQPKLRVASLISALSFAAFCAFWAVLSFLMHDRFGRGAREAGMFGLVGVAGAMCAPMAGRLSDRRGAAFTLVVALVFSLLSFVGMALWVSIPGLIAGVLLLDLGVQSTQVAAQAEVLGLVPEARNRLNTIYMVCRFAGGALGSAAGTLAYAHGGWSGTCIACSLVLLLAIAAQALASRGGV